MRSRGEELYELLPAVYRVRDAGLGHPLRALLGVIGEQVEVLDENLAQLYDDQFIETCDDWVVPYIGDLIGARGLYGLTESTYSRRAQVANTLAYRRRKGTAAVMEELARDVTGWPARVVEFFEVLSTSQHLNHLRPGNLGSPDLRLWEPLERLNTPFDNLAHTADVRRIAAGRGRYNVPNVGLFLWRLQAYRLSGDAFEVDDRRYTFDPLGTDTQLYVRPEAEDEISHVVEPTNVPMPLGRRDLHEYRDEYYGPNKSLLFEVDGQEVPREAIVVRDLSDAGEGAWAHEPGPGEYAVDPVLGRISVPAAPTTSVRVTYHHGFGADLGGGEYDRAGSFDPQLRPVQVPATSPPQAREAREALTGEDAAGTSVVIREGGRYSWEEVSGGLATPAIHAAGHVELRAEDGCRPVLALGADLVIDAEQDESEVTLDGLLIAGSTLRVRGNLGTLRLRHCTLVPETTPDAGGSAPAPALVIETGAQANTVVEIDRCVVVGGLLVSYCRRVRIKDSIVDAGDRARLAYGAPDTTVSPDNPIIVENATMIGEVRTTLLESASNSIFLGSVTSERAQAGSVRFSYLPPESRTPRRYRCQPATETDHRRTRPRFTSLRYGEPGYCQLRADSAAEIREGADDGGEMGVFHDLYQARRETNLCVRLDEYARFGLEVGIFYAS